MQDECNNCKVEYLNSSSYDKLNGCPGSLLRITFMAFSSFGQYSKLNAPSSTIVSAKDDDEMLESVQGIAIKINCILLQSLRLFL